MQIRWSPEAADNLEEIYHYLLTQNSPFTESTIQEIYDGIRSLRQMPHRGKPGRVKGTRELLLPKVPFVVAYAIKHEAVHVVSIRHTSRAPLAN